MEVSLSPRSRKDMSKIPLFDRPRAAHHDVVPMVGEPGRFRLRVGDWRIIFALEREAVVVVRMAHRREVYR